MNTQNQIFNSYDQRMRKNAEELARQAIFLRNVFTENYCTFCPPSRGQESILEIGCNKGFLMKAIKERYPESKSIGIDLSPHDIQYAKEYVPEAEFYCIDAFEYLEENQSKFDMIFAKDIMEHIPKDRQEKFVRLLHGALKENGLCIVQVPNMDWLFSMHERYMDFTHEVGYTRESFADIFRLAFGEKIQVEPSTYIWPSKEKSIKTRLAYRYVRPMLIRSLKYILKIIGEGASDTWFYHREIMVIARR